jgi:hypothetical protein
VQLDRRRLVLGGLSNFALFSPVFADYKNQYKKKFPFRFLDNAFIFEDIIIHTPPLNDLKESQILLSLKRYRTPQNIDLIKLENVGFLEFFYKTLDKSDFNGAFLNKILEDVLFDVFLIVLELKKKFKRRRPSQVLKQVEPVIEVPWHSSYPSGHATQATVISEVMGHYFSEKKEEFDLLAKRIGKNREIAGLHYPSDTDAGFVLGKYLSTFFLKQLNPIFNDSNFKI